MRRTISLDGDWERRDFLDEAWRWSDALRPTDRRATQGPPVQAGVSAGWRPARVPGSALDDAWHAGEIPNPHVDRNSLAAEWIPQRTWLYRRRFSVPADSFAHSALRFDGIEPGGTVFVDGHEVARHRGAFVPLEAEVTDAVGPGEHDLVVVVDPAPPMPSQVSRSELARRHASRMGYGWDFCPRMIHTGIWRSVSLELREAAWLRQPQLTVDADPRRAVVRTLCEVAGDAAGAELRARVVSCTDEREVASASAPVSTDGIVTISLEIDEPSLWWPNGIGAQALHRLELRLHHARGVLDERSVRFGIRSVRTARTEGSPPDALPYTLVVNGRPTWIRGWNWVPLDAAYGVPRPERLRHLVELARRANVNLLRVWGGGLIESDAFYDACDEAGIMVWQEFAQSSSGMSNTPSSDPEFVALMRREAEEIVPLRTHHPSLVTWCGGNELADDAGRPLNDRHPVLAALREVVGRLDPGRAWLPTSPSGPRFDNSLAAVGEDPASLHDVHGPWEHQGLAEQHALANATTSLLHSEFGVEGMTNLSTLRATVSARHRDPMNRSNPVMAHRGAWWINEPFVQAAFGGGLSAEELERASQHLQADGLRTLIEGDRRRWPRNAGAIPWQMNEPFPNAWCTSAVDYFGVPKAAYHAVADAYAPLLPGVSFDTQALAGRAPLVVTPWVVNDTGERLEGPMEVVLRDESGRRLDAVSMPVTCPANAVATCTAAPLALPPDAADLLVLDASFAGRSTRRLLSRTADLEPMRRLPRVALDASVEADGDAAWLVRLAVSGQAAAVEVRLADARPVGWPERIGAAYVEANLVTLLPAEQRSIRVEWRDVPSEARRMRLDGWNVDERVLSHG